MRGLELSRGYFLEYGLPMLERDFPELKKYIAAGLVGSGSERFGFDDTVSRDHDFEPGFCIFLPGEETVSRRDAFLLERAYASLPSEYMGFRRQKISPVGGNRSGVLRTAEFYRRETGSPDGLLSAAEWLSIPDSALAEATNGEVFADYYGEFTAIRERLLSMPRDIMLKRLAGNLLIMGQAGQYNLPRCLRHGEPEAAALAAGEFARAAMKSVCLLAGRYLPYYKWSFRALPEEGAAGAELKSKLSSFILLGGNAGGGEERARLAEEISSVISGMLRGKGLTDVPGSELELHAYSVNSMIADGNIRNMNILAGT